MHQWPTLSIRLLVWPLVAFGLRSGIRFEDAADLRAGRANTFWRAALVLLTGTRRLSARGMVSKFVFPVKRQRPMCRFDVVGFDFERIDKGALFFHALQSMGEDLLSSCGMFRGTWKALAALIRGTLCLATLLAREGFFFVAKSFKSLGQVPKPVFVEIINCRVMRRLNDFVFVVAQKASFVLV